MNGRELRRRFAEFNQRYFGGRLPNYHLRSVWHMTRLGESGDCHRRQRLIRILRSLTDDDAISCLLHEMAHAATKGHHGKSWKAEMIRLRREGAPLIGPDGEVALEDWSGEFVGQKHFRSVVQDLLIDQPDITLSSAVRHFYSNVGGPGPLSIARFRRKYPWVGRILRACREEHRERLKQVAELRRKLGLPEGASARIETPGL
jgi:hypothetical protein